ncbi:phosphomevalonate kinase [Acidipropionibacterium virtanenii]|uniref:phosphomevalonate kinase n=1 Tax=Acidipropionibacterium virtanenii TaxID=2057246 RepID=A0A344URZ4_9ACTN|nr:phosphomevalonate kinase [Acidipropionibacterium virtanenii]AXE38042.1 Phosphomevalonate kinase [Acidipropionibacterium virtanenii]
MIETSAPGKLYIAGEYAVVESGQPSVLVAVDRCITVRLSPSAGMGRVHSSRYGHGPLTWVRDEDDQIIADHNPYDYVTASITVMERLRAERGLAPRYFDLYISSELDDSSGRKFGLGSSAAVTVAVVAALDDFYGTGLSCDERFRLALLATIEVAPRSSGGDIAASTFGGFIRYTSPDRARLRQAASEGTITDALTDEGWQNCRVTRLSALPGLRLLVGWTGTPASTEGLVRRVSMSDAELDARYSAFLRMSREAVDQLVEAWDHDAETILSVIRRCRRLLQHLGQLRGTAIETDQLRTLCNVAEGAGAAAKPSGAGGGDCGIALIPDDHDVDGILAAWRADGVLPLDLKPHAATGEPIGATR